MMRWSDRLGRVKARRWPWRLTGVEITALAVCAAIIAGVLWWRGAHKQSAPGRAVTEIIAADNIDTAVVEPRKKRQRKSPAVKPPRHVPQPRQPLSEADRIDQ